jgi:hypothetical protein
MSKLTKEDELRIFNEVISKLMPLSEDSRVKLLQTIATFLGIEASHFQTSSVASGGQQARIPSSPSTFSEKKDISPKEFLLLKQPRNDVERVACLAYYLTHYRNTPEFKTLDISKLNTEAAQPKFSNASVPVDNARQKAFLVSTTRGNKQLGALGERFVQALPDREAAKNVMQNLRVRRFRRSKKGRVGAEETPAMVT